MKLPHPRKLRQGAAPFDRHVTGINYGLLDQLVIYAVRRAQISIYEELEPILSPLALTPPRFSSLVLIEQNPEILQSDLARIIGVGRPAMVAIINFLAEQGWIQRQSHDGDGRANLLILTSKGRTHLAKAKKLIAQLDQRWTSTMSNEERISLMALLDRLGPPGACAAAEPADLV